MNTLIIIFIVCIICTILIAEILGFCIRRFILSKINLNNKSSQIKNIIDGFELLYYGIYSVGLLFAAITFLGIISKFIITIISLVTGEGTAC